MQVRSMTVGIAAAMLALYGAAGSSALRVAAQAPPAPAADKLAVPTDYFKLKNGLKVVLSRDTTTPTVVVARLLQHRLPHRAEGPHRLRASLRAHDVPGLAEPRQDGVHPARRIERRPPQRLDALRLHELLRGRSVARARDRCCGPRPIACGASNIDAENLKNQQEVVKNEVQGQRPESALRRLPVDRPAAWRRTRTGTTPTTSTATSKHLDAATLDDVRDVLQDVLRAEQRGARGHRRLRRRRRRRRGSRNTSRDIPTAKLPPPADSDRAAAGEGEARRGGPIRWRIGRRSASPITCPDRLTPEWYAFGLIDQRARAGRGLAPL